MVDSTYKNEYNMFDDKGKGVKYEVFGIEEAAE